MAVPHARLLFRALLLCALLALALMRTALPMALLGFKFVLSGIFPPLVPNVPLAVLATLPHQPLQLARRLKRHAFAPLATADLTQPLLLLVRGALLAHIK